MTAAVALVAGLVVLTTAEAGASSNRGQPVPECGREAVQLCHIDITVHQGPPTAGAVCGSFDDGTGFCVGPSRGNFVLDRTLVLSQAGSGASFTWKSQGSVRMVNYEANATFTILEAKIEGRVPSPSSARLDVTDAWNRGSAVHWHTGMVGAAGSRWWTAVHRLRAQVRWQLCPYVRLLGAQSRHVTFAAKGAPSAGLGRISLLVC